MFVAWPHAHTLRERKIMQDEEDAIGKITNVNSNYLWCLWDQWLLHFAGFKIFQVFSNN